MATQSGFVFRDFSGGRWRWFRRGALLLLCALVAAVLVVMGALLAIPQLKDATSLHTAIHMIRGGVPPVQSASPDLPATWLRQDHGPANQNWVSTAESGRSSGLRVGFVPHGDARSIHSIKEHHQALTHIVPSWLTVSGMAPTIRVQSDEETEEAVSTSGAALIPLLSNLNGRSFDPEAVEYYLQADERTRAAFGEELVSQLQEMHAAGVAIEWEQLDPAYTSDLTAFIKQLQEILHHAALELWLCIPVGNDIKIFDLDELAPYVDRFIAMLYYETGEDDTPGPIASLPWFKDWLDVLLEHGRPEQWVIGVGTFSYDWSANSLAEQISFQEAMGRGASAAGLQIEVPENQSGPWYTYQDQTATHTVWFLDAITFRNQLKEITQRSVAGVALHRVGFEDPAVWEVLRCGSGCKPSDFNTIRPPDEVSGIGDGDFITIAKAHREGARAVREDSEGLWREEYLHPPEAAVVYHQGGADRRMVSLTFDDGPDPQYTPQILDILKSAGVSATFFVVGKNAVAYPDIVTRMQREGHEIGNHTYSHVNLASSGALRLTLELNATQRIIENLTGRSTLLFRPPYDVDRTPQTADELDALLEAQRLGYLPVMASIDPLDWEEPTAAEILERVKEQRSEGSTLLLHDGGGNRAATVAALPKILEYFNQRGDIVVPLHRQIRVDLDVVMPAVNKDTQASARYVAGTGISVISMIEAVSFTFLFGITVLLIMRTGILVLLAAVHYLRGTRRDSETPLGTTQQPVSVVIAAYNEEQGIAATIRSILASGYRGPLELVVVDDGSSDDTARVVAGLQKEYHEVRLITQSNRGKAEALSVGIAASVHPWIVTFDADTICSPGCIERLVQPLHNPFVGAVSGNIKVRNCSSLLGKMQALEYEIAFSIDKRAHDLIDAIIVAPGAASAYKRSAIVAAGGLSGDTLAEDTDLTLEMHSRDFRTRYAPTAIAMTESPETIRGFVRQRKRWSFGTLQCLWKHRGQLFRPGGGALSWFAIPSVWICHLGVTALTPLVDIAFLLSLVGGVYPSLVWYSLTFLLIDGVLAVVAMALDGGVGWRVLWVIPMRFLYRPLLSFAVLASLVRALKGQLVGWGAQERIGVPPAPKLP